MKETIIVLTMGKTIIVLIMRKMVEMKNIK
jgi:hypothetical protein